jgi:hypothetical protein
MLTGTMKLSYEVVSKPPRWTRPPKTPFKPRKKIVGASTPGIAAPGTRTSSFLARTISAAIVARLVRQAGVAGAPPAIVSVAASISPPATGAGGRGR